MTPVSHHAPLSQPERCSRVAPQSLSGYARVGLRTRTRCLLLLSRGRDAIGECAHKKDDGGQHGKGDADDELAHAFGLGDTRKEGRQQPTART